MPIPLLSSAAQTPENSTATISQLNCGDSTRDDRAEADFMSPRANVERLRHAAPVILPSLLLCDFSNLEREVRLLEAAGAEALHLDVMDGCFVPNITYGMPIVAAVRRLTELPLDVHLMIMEPAKYAEQFRDAGADLLTVHVESNGDARRAAAADPGVGNGGWDRLGHGHAAVAHRGLSGSVRFGPCDERPSWVWQAAV